MLVLDCSNSLGNDFISVQNAAKNFIDVLSSNSGISAPFAPTGVTATALSSNSIKVSWNAVPRATSYDIYYEKGNSTTKTYIGNTSSTVYTHTGLQTNTTYYYYIKAVNRIGSSDYSIFGTAKTMY